MRDDGANYAVALEKAGVPVTIKEYPGTIHGFFVCGFHILFIMTHAPAFLIDRGLSPQIGTIVLALIGLFNIFGT